MIKLDSGREIEYILLNYERWIIKKQACFKALSLANSVLSNFEYPNIAKKDITPQKFSIEDARSCVDELAISCESPETLNILKEIIFGSVSPDKIVDLRNAIRAELNFAGNEIDIDRKKSFIGKLNCVASRIKDN